MHAVYSLKVRRAVRVLMVFHKLESSGGRVGWNLVWQCRSTSDSVASFRQTYQTICINTNARWSLLDYDMIPTESVPLAMYQTKHELIRTRYILVSPLRSWISPLELQSLRSLNTVRSGRSWSLHTLGFKLVKHPQHLSMRFNTDSGI